MGGCMSQVDDLDRRIIDLLRLNSRESITQLANALGVNRATVQERIRRLEKNKVIKAYTIDVNPDYQRNMVSAHTMITSDPQKTRKLCTLLSKLPAVKSLHSVNGEYDLVALMLVPSTEDLDDQLEVIGEMDGVIKTTTLILLSKVI